MIERTAYLRAYVIGGLRGDPDVQDALGDGGAVLPVNSVLGPDPADADPRLLVDVEAADSNRQNKQEHKRFNVFLTVEATPRQMRTGGQNLLARLLDAAVDLVTEHPQGLTARGVIDEQNLGFVEGVNRFRRVAQCRLERRDLHPAQTDN